MLEIKQQIIEKIEEVLKELGIKDQNISLEIPEDLAHGDFTTNVAMRVVKNDKGLMIKDKKETPFEFAKKLIERLNHSSFIINHCSRVEAVPPGFVNFYLSKDYLLKNLEFYSSSEVEKSKKDSSRFAMFSRTVNKFTGKKIVVEYSSPNIAKPFTVGHLRSTIIGDAVANLLQSQGAIVYRDNHIGDWGTQFGKQIYAIKTWGNEEEIDRSENPVKLLVSLYVKFHSEAENNPEIENAAREWFKKLEDGDKEARRLWQKCIDWSWKEFEKIYEELNVPSVENVSFENGGRGYGESFFEDKMQSVIAELKEKGLLKGSEGAQVIFFPKDKYPPLLIVKKDGATLYATRDLATDRFRLDRYGKDVIIINEVGAEQSLYFNQLYEAERMLGWVKEGQRIHIKHGLYRFKDEKMSTRKGNVIWLEDVLEKVQKQAWKLSGVDMQLEGSHVVSRSIKVTESSRKNLPKGGATINNGKIIGINALKWNDLKNTSQSDVVFDWGVILNMQGNSGPYMQYAYVRTQSILSKVKNENHELPARNASISVAGGRIHSSDIELNKEESDLLRIINQYEELLRIASENFAPNMLCNYLYNLAKAFNFFYQKHRILDTKDMQQKQLRIELTKGVGTVIKNGLSILGIETPEKM